MKKSLVLATALFLATAIPLSFAQAPMPATPPTASTPAHEARETPGQEKRENTAATAAHEARETPARENRENAGACHTGKAVGSACSCRKAPTVMGVSTASPTGGRHMCVMS